MRRSIGDPVRGAESYGIFEWINPSDQDRAEGQSINGRLWDMLTMLRNAIKAARPGADQLEFSFIVRRPCRHCRLDRTTRRAARDFRLCSRRQHAIVLTRTSRDPLSKEAFMWWSFKPYVSVAERRAKAAGEIKKLQKKGRTILPVQIEGKTIARTFWGKAWCDNLESYSDFENRLPRGRSYVRNGSVCDLQIEPGRVTALVCGSELYKIKIAIKPLSPQCWAAVKRQCAGQIGSLIELLGGKLSQGVMQIITRRDGGLFPKPAEIDLDCSCPDWADLCKHVAAALYGVGARLDDRPEALFVLRQVDHLELISEAGDVRALTKGRRAQKTIAADALSNVFGIDLEPEVKNDSADELPLSAKTKRRSRTPAATASAASSRRPSGLKRGHHEGNRGSRPAASPERPQAPGRTPRAKNSAR